MRTLLLPLLVLLAAPLAAQQSVPEGTPVPRYMTDAEKVLWNGGAMVARGTGTLPPERLTELVRKNFDLTPYGIREMLDLLHPIYRSTAAYGHFGRENEGFGWEKTDKAEQLKADAGV